MTKLTKTTILSMIAALGLVSMGARAEDQSSSSTSSTTATTPSSSTTSSATTDKDSSKPEDQINKTHSRPMNNHKALTGNGNSGLRPIKAQQDPNSKADDQRPQTVGPNKGDTTPRSDADKSDTNKSDQKRLYASHEAARRAGRRCVAAGRWAAVARRSHFRSSTWRFAPFVGVQLSGCGQGSRRIAQGRVSRQPGRGITDNQGCNQ